MKYRSRSAAIGSNQFHDYPLIACPICAQAMRPQGQGLVSHLQKHVREGKISQTEMQTLKLKIRGVPEK